MEVFLLVNFFFSLIAELVKNPPVMQETLVQFLGQEDPLEEGMATLSSVLAWRIPWTEEPGGLQSIGLQRVGHDRATFTLGFPHSSAGKRMCLQCRRPWFDSWVGKIHWQRDRLPTSLFLGFPCSSAGKESTLNAGYLGLIPGLGRSPGEGKGYPL